MLNQYNVVKVISEQWLTSLSGPLKQIRFPVGCLLCWQKSHWGGGPENYLPQTSMDEAEKSIYHYLAVVIFFFFFWEGMYSAFQRRANNGMLFVNGQCCG